MDSEVYQYWRSERARAKANDPLTHYYRRQERDERNYDPCRFHDIDCQCADCMWEEEPEFRPYPYKSEWDLQREAELAAFDSDAMEASWGRGRWITKA